MPSHAEPAGHRLHAARSDVIDIVWLVSRLMDIETSCCMEEGGSANHDLPIMEGLDLSIRKTRRKFGPFRFRVETGRALWASLCANLSS